MKAGDNLQLLGLVEILAVLCDFGSLGPSLLLHLAQLDPLLHCQVLAQLRESVGFEAQLVQHGTVADRVEEDLVVWSAMYCV